MRWKTIGRLTAVVAVAGSIAVEAQEGTAMTIERKPSDDRRMAAVVEFADNVLERGRDRWSGQDSPLLADGIDPVTGEPAKWWYNGKSYIIHNLASQQNLFRVFRGLTRLTGDARYEEAARDAVSYHFETLRSPCGKLYWGGHQFVDLSTLEPVGHFDANCHELKSNFPFYDLLWDVDPEATRRYTRALWAGHVLNWRNLDMNRHAGYHDGPAPTEEVWDQPFDDPAPYFEGKGLTFLNCGADLIYAAGMLYGLSGEKGALDWARRLAGMYTKGRHPVTGMGTYQYSKPQRRREPPAEGPLKGGLTSSSYGDRIENKFGHSGSSDPDDEFYNPVKDKVAADGLLVAREGWVWSTSGGFPWYTLVQLALAEKLGESAQWFAEDAADHLEAHARHAYDPETNQFRPMWADGTDVTGLKIPRTGYGAGRKGDVYPHSSASPTHLAAYARGYRMTRRESLWRSARDMARGLKLGDVGASPQGDPDLDGSAPDPVPELVFALLELYRAAPHLEYLDAAREIADRMLAQRFHHGFFMSSPEHRYAKFDVREPLAILTLEAVLRGTPARVPVYVGGRGYIHGRFDGLGRTYDGNAVWSQLRSETPPQERPRQRRPEAKPPVSKDGMLQFNGEDQMLIWDKANTAFEDGDRFSIVVRARMYDDNRFLCGYRYHLSRQDFRTRGRDPLTISLDMPKREEPYLIVITYDGAGEGGSRTLRAYVDGKLAGTASGNGSPLSTYSAGPLTLGYTRHSSGIFSRVDIFGDVQVLDRVLTREDIAALAAQ